MVLSVHNQSYMVHSSIRAQDIFIPFYRKRGSSVVRHLPLVLEVQGSIPASG